MLLEPEWKRFSFSIISPTVTIQRVEPTSNEDRIFALKITVDDRYRAVGGYSSAINGGNPSSAKYTVTALTNKGEVAIKTFELTKDIETKSNGRIVIKQPTLYTVLKKLEK